MMRKAIAAAAVAMSLTGAHANNVFIHSGYVTGLRYTDLSRDEQIAFVVGVSDGLLVAPAMDGDQGLSNKLKACLRRIEVVQLHAMVNRWVYDNPDKWHNGLAIHVYTILRKACDLK